MIRECIVIHVHESIYACWSALILLYWCCCQWCSACISLQCSVQLCITYIPFYFVLILLYSCQRENFSIPILFLRTVTHSIRLKIRNTFASASIVFLSPFQSSIWAIAAAAVLRHRISLQFSSVEFVLRIVYIVLHGITQQHFSASVLIFACEFYRNLI